jgi:hypothetical protein
MCFDLKMTTTTATKVPTMAAVTPISTWFILSHASVLSLASVFLRFFFPCLFLASERVKERMIPVLVNTGVDFFFAAREK